MVVAETNPQGAAAGSGILVSTTKIQNQRQNCFLVIFFRLATVAIADVKPTSTVKRIMALDVSANAESDEKWGGVGQ